MTKGYKMATTDAISYACQQLGIAGDIYMGYEKRKVNMTGADTEPVRLPDIRVRLKRLLLVSPLKNGPKNKFGMDIGGLFGKPRGSISI